MRRSLGLVESESGGRLVLPEAKFGREASEGGHVSWMRKERHTVETEVGKIAGGDEDEDGEAVGEAVGVGVVESQSVCSESSFGSRGVRGGTSSTSTCE